MLIEFLYLIFKIRLPMKGARFVYILTPKLNRTV